jgi:hypothetical protein
VGVRARPQLQSLNSQRAIQWRTCRLATQLRTKTSLSCNSHNSPRPHTKRPSQRRSINPRDAPAAGRRWFAECASPPRRVREMINFLPGFLPGIVHIGAIVTQVAGAIVRSQNASAISHGAQGLTAGSRGWCIGRSGFPVCVSRPGEDSERCTRHLPQRGRPSAHPRAPRRCCYLLAASRGW